MVQYADYQSILLATNFVGGAGKNNLSTISGESDQRAVIGVDSNGVYQFYYAILSSASELAALGYYSSGVDREYTQLSTSGPALSISQSAILAGILSPSAWGGSFSDVAKIDFNLGNTTTADIVFGATKNGGTPSIDASTAAYELDYTGGYSALKHGDIWLNEDATAYWDLTDVGSAGHFALLHELGHALGLDHIDSTPAIDSHQYSVMSYNFMSGMEPAGADNEVTPFGLQLLDIAAIQEIYGRNWNTRDDDTTYSAATAFASTRPNGAFIYTIWDGDGDDTINVSAYSNTQGVIVDLRQGEFSSIGYNAEGGAAVHNLAIAYHTIIENAVGTAYGDILIGNAWNNNIQGGDGNDRIFGDGLTLDDDSVVGVIYNNNAGFGAGNGEHDSNNPEAAPPSDDSGNDTLDGGAGNDFLYGGSGADTLIGGTGNDELYGGAGNDILRPGAGTNVINGGTGTDLVDYSDLTVAVDVDLASGTDSLGNTLISIEQIIPSAFGGEQTGTSGNDTLNSGIGDDILIGGAGQDLYVYNGGSDTIIDEGTDTPLIRMNLGLTASDISSSVSGTYITLHVNGYGDVEMQNSTLVGASAKFTYIRNASDQVIHVIYYGSAGVNNLYYDTGTAGSTIFGNAGNDSLQVWGAEKIIYGGDGNDYIRSGGDVGTLYGEGGDDKLYLEPYGNGTIGRAYGGDGNDEFTISAYDTSIIEAYGGAGNDTFKTYALPISLGSLFSGGSGDDLFEVSANYHLLTADGGDDDDFYRLSVGTTDLGGHIIIKDSSGTDTISVQGISTYTVNSFRFEVSNYNDLLIINTHGTVDFAFATIEDYFVGNKVEYFKPYYYSSNIFLIDDLLTFVIQGTASNDTLTGDSANNIIFGNAGNDTLAGAAGADTLDGGADADTASYAAAAAGVTVSLALGTASDDGDGSADTLTALENVTGSAYADTITGDGAANVLSGAAGADTLDGGDGNDTLIGGAGNDTLTGGNGTDTADYSGASGGVTLTLHAGSASADGDGGTDTLSGIENVTGSAYADSITGSDGDNVIITGNGGDTVAARSGNDTIIGGAGIDILYGSNGDDTIWGGGAADDIRGENDNDTLYGEAGDDALRGGNGNDILDGGDGNDSLYGNDGDDVFIASAGDDAMDGSSGTDTLDYSIWGQGVTVNLFAGTLDKDGDTVTDDTLLSIENFIGTDYADSITGGTGANVIYAGGGNDSVYARAGNDILYGEAGDDTLNGVDGDDTLYGGTGADTMTGSTGADVFVWLAEDLDGSLDTITDFAAGGADVIDIGDVLFDAGYDPLSDLLSDFVRFTEGASSTTLYIDTAGTGTFGAANDVATLSGVTTILAGGSGTNSTETDLQNLVSAGTLVV